MAGRIRIPPYRPLDVHTPAVPGGGYLSIDASAGQFGPSPLLQLGLQAAEGVAGIATVVSEHVGRDNEAVVKDADTRLGEAEQTLLFDPRNGYLNTQGETALRHAPAVLEAYTKAQDRALAGTADDDQRGMLQGLIERRLASFTTQVERHASAERQRWYDQAGELRIAHMQADARLHWSDDALLRRALGTTRAEVREKAERHGWDSPLTEAALRQQTGRTLVSAIEAAVERDPERAQVLRTRYAAVIEDHDRAALDALLSEAQTRQRAQAASTVILSATPPADEPSTAQWRLRQAEAIAEPAVRAAAIRRLLSATAEAQARARALAEQVLARVLKDGLTDPSQIPVRDWVALDAEHRQAIEGRLDHNTREIEPARNPALVDELATEMTQAPHAFARRDLVPAVAQLPLPQWQRFRDWQTGIRRNDPATEEQLYAIKRGLQLAERMLPASGADEATSTRAELVEEIDTRRRITGKSPDDADIADMLARHVPTEPHTAQTLEWDPRVRTESTRLRFAPSLARPDDRPGILRVQDRSKPGQEQDESKKDRDFWDWLLLFLELFSESSVPTAPPSPRQTGPAPRRVPPHSTKPQLPGRPQPPAQPTPASTTKPSSALDSRSGPPSIRTPNAPTTSPPTDTVPGRAVGGASRGIPNFRPFKPGGHHIIPKEVYEPLGLPDKALTVFERATTGYLKSGSHTYNRPHRVYSDVVAEVVDRWIKRKGIQRHKMTEAEANQLIDYIMSHEHPVIREYLNHLHSSRR